MSPRQAECVSKITEAWGLPEILTVPHTCEALAPSFLPELRL